MRGNGDLSNRMDMARAALLLDLHAAGVRAEMGEGRFVWDQPSPVAMVGPAAAERGVVVPILPRTQQVDEVRREVPRAAEAARARVWSTGEPEGVVVVVQGAEVLRGEAAALLGRMLKAAAFGGLPLGWVGVDNLEHGEAAALQVEVVAAIQALRPVRVLVLGQQVLSVFTGRKVGVEGWQAAPTALPGCEGAVAGVTYPPELLLAQPLFKRLAWQHLLAWRAAG